MPVGAPDSSSPVRRISEDRLSRFTVGTGYDKVPIEGLTAMQLHGGKLARSVVGETGLQYRSL